MKCNCCGRRKKLFESFEKIAPEINVCVECSTLLYKIKDSMNDDNKEEKAAILKQLNKRRGNNSSKDFDEWLKGFMK